MNETWQPFYEKAWPRTKRDAAQALWHWHLALHDPTVPALDGDDLTAYFEAEQKKAADGEPLKLVPEDVWQPAYRACSEYGLPQELLASQVAGARRRHPPVRFTDQADLRGFLASWALPLGQLLAHLANVGHSWQLRPVDEIAQGFFRVGRLAELPQDLASDRLFIPRQDVEQYGVPLEALRQGHIDESVRRLLWREIVRARDHLAQGRSLYKELSGRQGRAFKRWWLGALAVLEEIERRDYDVWSEPLELSFYQRVQVRWQALFGKMTFR